MEIDPTTASECLRAAMQALLRGDTAERDRLCDRAKVLIQAERYAGAVERVMAVDFYVKANGVCFPTKLMAKAAGAIN